MTRPRKSNGEPPYGSSRQIGFVPSTKQQHSPPIIRQSDKFRQIPTLFRLFRPRPDRGAATPSCCAETLLGAGVRSSPIAVANKRLTPQIGFARSKKHRRARPSQKLASSRELLAALAAHIPVRRGRLFFDAQNAQISKLVGQPSWLVWRAQLAWPRCEQTAYTQIGFVPSKTDSSLFRRRRHFFPCTKCTNFEAPGAVTSGYPWQAQLARRSKQSTHAKLASKHRGARPSQETGVFQRILGGTHPMSGEVGFFSDAQNAQISKLVAQPSWLVWRAQLACTRCEQTAYPHIGFVPSKTTHPCSGVVAIFSRAQSAQISKLRARSPRAAPAPPPPLASPETRICYTEVSL